MKIFRDLVFEEHRSKNAGYDRHAKINFPNGYGLSVINGESAYCSDDEYECAILNNDYLCSDSGLGGPIVEDCTEDDISDLMVKLQLLKERK